MKKHSMTYLQAKRRLAESIDAQGLLKEGDRIVIGVSGGADSVFLLSFLQERRAKSGISLRVLHVHHGLRESADEDAGFVKELCEKYDIPCAVVRVDVKEYGREKGLGIEEAARILRHKALEEAAEKWDEEVRALGDGDKNRAAIALAHHLNDQAETVLHNLVRGTSLKGLGGMAQKSGRIIRPLLVLSRDEIEMMLEEDGLSWRDDETNAEEIYTRNRIRHTVLPLLRREVNEQADLHIAEAARDIAEAESVLARETAKLLEEATMQRTGGDAEEKALRVGTLLCAEPILAKRVLHLAISEEAGVRKDIGRVHIEDVYGMLSGKERAKISLPYGILAVREYGQLYFRKK